MNADRGIDSLIQRARGSNLPPDRKAQAIRILEAIRRALQAVQRFMQSLLAWIREHRDAAEVLAIALLVAILLKAIPVIGELLAFLAILLGAIAALVVEVKRTLNNLFNFEFAKEDQN